MSRVEVLFPDSLSGPSPSVSSLDRIFADGQLFALGHDGYSQKGAGSASQGLSPKLITTNLQNKKVSKVTCGSHHSMALTHDGEVQLLLHIVDYSSALCN